MPSSQARDPSELSAEELILAPYDSPNHPLAPWFADARRERAAGRDRAGARLVAGSGAPTRAMITIVHNEPVFLPIWLSYYSRFFAPEDIYVLDNESNDPVIESGGAFRRTSVPHGRVDHMWMVSTVQAVQHDLLRSYDIVVFSDVDELIVPVPTLGTLGDYLDRFDEPWVNCLGYEILHLRDREPPLSLQQPILAQRHHWFYNDAYDKAAVTTVPIEWRPGFHGRSDGAYNLDPDLRLVHLHRVDYDICLARHRTRSRRPWAVQDEQLGWAAHNSITEEPEFARWFYEDSCFEDLDIHLEEIDPVWGHAF
jgi:Glycosyl transferase family 2